MEKSEVRRRGELRKAATSPSMPPRVAGIPGNEGSGRTERRYEPTAFPMLIRSSTA